ncbi:MAG: DUF5302 domain-containing protein [Nocardioidaceae bacterium]
MSDEMDPNEELKAKMRAALDRKKKGADAGVDGAAHVKEKPPETHGPQGGVHVHRRKAGGGGS